MTTHFRLSIAALSLAATLGLTSLTAFAMGDVIANNPAAFAAARQ